MANGNKYNTVKYGYYDNKKGFSFFLGKWDILLRKLYLVYNKADFCMQGRDILCFF